MKKFFIVIVLCVLSMSVYAQEVDSLKCDSVNACIDSLATQLSKLQKDYDYLYCKYTIDEIEDELDDFINRVDIKSNSVLINYYGHSRTDVDLYISYRNNYNSSLELFNTLKENATSTKTFVAMKMISSNFSDQELSVLNSGCSYIDTCLSQAQNSLSYYKTVIDAYKMK